MSEDKFNAIVVGAGPAGCACAYTLAKAGREVLLVERGATAGSKNLTGGRVYTYALELVEPGLWREAPLERKVVKEQITMVGPNRNGITIDYTDYGFRGEEEFPQSFTVLRAPFDEWFAAQAEAKGAMLATGVKVDGLLTENGRIIGIKAGDDELYGDVVVAADGVNSFLAQQAGLHAGIQAQAMGTGVKEVIDLPAEEIEKRFNLSPDEGVARVVLGCTEGIPGGGFLYTNRTSVSLGLVFNPTVAAQKGHKLHEIMQDFKTSPLIEPLIAGGTTVEYGAHLVPEAGWRGLPQRLYKDGMLVCGDAGGLVINSGTSIRGIDLAVVSGVAAARAILAEDNPSSVGPLYMEELEKLHLIPTMKVFKGWPEVMENPRLFTAYPALGNEMFKHLFRVDGQVPPRLSRAMWRILRQHVSLRELMADGWKGMQAI